MKLKDVTTYPVNVSTNEFSDEYMSQVKSSDSFKKLTQGMTDSLLNGLLSDDLISQLVDEISGQDSQISISPLAVKLILQSLESISDKVNLDQVVMDNLDDDLLNDLADTFVDSYVSVKKTLLSKGKRVVEEGLGSERLSYFHTSAFRSRDQIGDKRPKSLPSVKLHSTIDGKFKDETLKRVADPKDNFSSTINAAGKVTSDDIDYIKSHLITSGDSDEKDN